MRVLWFIGGWTSFAIGAVGLIVPLLPSVPFMLLAAFCFARSSERFHAWLTGHRRFGPAILAWQAYGAIGPKAKLAAMVAMAGSLAISLALGVPGPAIALQAAVLAAVAVFILTRPDGPPG